MTAWYRNPGVCLTKRSLVTNIMEPGMRYVRCRVIQAANQDKDYDLDDGVKLQSDGKNNEVRRCRLNTSGC